MNIFEKNISDDLALSNGRAVAAVLDKQREPVLITGGELRIEFANTAARAAFSRLREGSFGKRLTEVIRDLSLHKAFKLALREKRTSQVRLEMPSKETKTYDARISPLELEGRSLALGVFYDATQIENLERVRQAFLSNISHELRTPLTSILAFVETLEDGAIGDTENNRRFLGIIRKNAERMRLLIDDISELSSIESGNVRIRIQQFRLHDLVEEVVASFTAQAAERGIVVKNEVPQKARIAADRVRVGQMLANLVDNAIKFNRRNGSVTVGFSASDDSAAIEVADTGEGIPREYTQRIFERLYRIDRARSREVGGTGLGLAIVKHLARLHGGRISLTSVPGEGSVFRIELPFSGGPAS